MLGVQPGIVHSSGGEAPESAPIEAPVFAIDDFLPEQEAARLRAAIELHFAEPENHQPERHQIWNYWYVPQLYTYLRTSPEKVVPLPLATRFHETLSVFAREVLGLGHVTWPNLSLYVDGCEQLLHNDSVNGRLGFVYSLTREPRKTSGGETIVLREGDPFRSNMSRAAAGSGLYDLIEPSFNRLTLFDDRMPHGVRRVEGSMDPLEGRIVLHGHISELGTLAEGSLSAEAVAAPIEAALAPLLVEAGSGAGICHGPLTIRLTITASGRIARLATLLNRVAREDGGSARPIVERALMAIRALSWPQTPDPTEAIVPIMFGGPLPWMKRS